MTDFKAGFQIVGMLGGKRELKSNKNPEWRGYIVVMQTLGSSLEVSVDEREYATLHEGKAYTVRGNFEVRQGRVNLIGKLFEPYKPERMAS